MAQTVPTDEGSPCPTLSDVSGTPPLLPVHLSPTEQSTGALETYRRTVDVPRSVPRPESQFRLLAVPDAAEQVVSFSSPCASLPILEYRES